MGEHVARRHVQVLGELSSGPAPVGVGVHELHDAVLRATDLEDGRDTHDEDWRRRRRSRIVTAGRVVEARSATQDDPPRSTVDDRDWSGGERGRAGPEPRRASSRAPPRSTSNAQGLALVAVLAELTPCRGGPPLSRRWRAGWRTTPAAIIAREQHFHLALSLASGGDDRDLGAQVLGSLSHLAHHRGKPELGLTYAGQGQRLLGGVTRRQATRVRASSGPHRRPLRCIPSR
jgi:hypothetical protein